MRATRGRQGNAGVMRAATGALMMAVLAAFTVPAGMAADNTPAPMNGVLIAQAGDAQRFAIPEQPLAAALTRFSEQTGISFAYKSEDVADRRSPGVEGTLT